MKRVAVLIGVVLLLAACGGGGNPAVDQIKAAWTHFFTTKGSLADHVALVQDGPRFKSAIQYFLGLPIASSVSATVSKVTLNHAENRAEVIYSVKVSGFSLDNQVGEGVLQGGTWKVAASTVCKLVSLAGSPPPACKS